MKLQQTELTVLENTDARIYYCLTAADGKPVQADFPNGITLSKGQSLHLGSFFNSFSIAKWKKYTRVDRFLVRLRTRGTVRITLTGAQVGDPVVTQILAQQTVADDGESVIIIPETSCTIVYPVVEALEDGAGLDALSYEGELAGAPNAVQLAIDICTFRREIYLQRNVDRLRQAFLANPSSALYGNLEVFISDNAGTIGDTYAEYEGVHVYPNANVGGAGGFTRGMIEAMRFPRSKPFSHIILMDDDAIIHPQAVQRTYTLLQCLKEEYIGHTIGGALLREQNPTVQYESGAIWNRGRIVAGHHDYDLADYDMVVRNEEEQPVEYTGWWYTVFPVQRIREVGLPLPIFIHRDDIEYGMRASDGKVILMNGIGVWHEAFENKMPGATEYYDLRNMAIVNSMHYPDYSAKELKKFTRKWVLSNLFRYRYRYVTMNLQGVQDFLKGIDWLEAQDAEQLHKKLLGMNYKAQDAAEYVGECGITADMLTWSRLEHQAEKPVGKVERLLKQITLNGLFFPASGIAVSKPHGNLYGYYRKREILYVDSGAKAILLKRNRTELRACLKQLRKTMHAIDEEFEAARKSYATRYRELTAFEFWKRYLGLDQ